MKLRNLFFALLALPLAFVACEPAPEPEPQPEPKPEPGVNTPVLTLTSNDVLDFEAEGGIGFIRYTLENAVEGVELNATCEADWVTDLVAGDNVVFKVVANEGEARTTKVVVSYDTQSFEVTVNQAAKGGNSSAPSINISSDNPMTLNHKEQTATISYYITNPIEGVSLTASENADWINQLSVNEANREVVFMVDYNSGDAREAVVTLTYGLLEEKVTIKQSEYVELAPEIIVDAAQTEFPAEGGRSVIEFHIDNAVEGVEATATSNVEWITIDSMAAETINITVLANSDEAVRTGVITIAYGEIKQEVKIMQLFDDYNPDLQYSVFQIVECWASMENGGAQWNVTFVEHDDTLGDMQTRISFALAQPNTQRVTDGVYSVENGGILTNTASLNGFSSYRNNTSIAADITVAEFTVATDTEAKTISFTGTFQAGNDVVTLDYNGEMSGMDLSEAVVGAINHTEWASVVKNWHDNKELLFTATSADGSLTVVFDFYDYDSAKSLAEGVYPVLSGTDGNGIQHLRTTSKFTYKNVESILTEGSATVEHIAGGYKITYNVIDELGREFTGVIEGPIEGAVNP